MSKHRETTGNPHHGNNTLIVRVRETLFLSSAPVYHGSECRWCSHFDACKDIKGRIAGSNYCHRPSVGFQPQKFSCKLKEGL